MNTMKALTVHIGIFGKTNSGKSSLMNLITDQQTSIVSEVAGTTTDLVYKQMEVNPLGSITFIDTAGIDDKSLIGGARLEKTQKAMDSSDIIILVCEAGNFDTFEENIISEAKKRDTPVIIAVNKIDIKKPDEDFLKRLKEHSRNIIQLSAIDIKERDAFLNSFKNIIIDILPENYIENYISLRKIIKEDDTIVLVIPIDLGAPRGRLIMPQVQTIRNILDLNACAYAVKDTEYKTALKNLSVSPALVIADSQVVKKIAEKTPDNIKLTTFSTVFSADKADIIEMAKGAAKLKKLKKGDKVLIAEACTHHSSKDDIGRVKIPKWLKEYTGVDLEIDISSGQDYPKDLQKYKAIIHCGACTLNRKAMLARLNKSSEAGIPITNYGIAISVFQGVIEKVLEVFPEALKAYKKETLV